MHLLAELADRVALVALLVGVVELGEHFGERRVIVDEALEAGDLRDEVRHLGMVLGGRHQEEDRVEVALFGDDAVLAKEARENGSGNAEVGVLARRGVDARRGEQELARVDEVLLRRIAFEVVPLVLGIEGEEPDVGRDLLRRVAVPGLAVDRGRNEGLDVVAAGEHFLARIDRDAHAVGPEAAAGFTLVHLRVDVERGEERIEGRGGRVHHEGVVEALVGAVALLALDVKVLLVDLGGLREAGLLLVDGLRHEDAGILGTEVEQERRAVLHHRDELFVADPGGVEEDVVAQVADAVDHLTGVVDRAVVGAKLDDGEAERALFIGALGRNLADELAQVLLVEAVVVDAADEAVAVAGGLEVDGRRARLNERAVMVRLVVVAVEEHQIARREQRVEHDLVGGGGAVEDEVRLVGVVDLGGRHLGGAGHAFVDEKVAHRDVCVAEVGAEDVFAEEVGELTACRMTAEEGAALVTRTVEVHVAVADVGLHLAEEGRKNLILVLLGGGVDQATVEANVVGLGVDDGDDLAEELGRELGAVVEQNDGNAERRRLDAFELARERLVGRHHDGRDAREVGLVEVDDDAFGLEGVQRAGRRCNVVSAHVGLRTGGKGVVGRKDPWS